MRVYTFESSGPALIPEDQLDVPSGPRVGWAPSLPITGYWKVGDKLSLGSVEYVCTTEGSPGVWVPSAGGGGSVLASEIIAPIGATLPVKTTVPSGNEAMLVVNDVVTGSPPVLPSDRLESKFGVAHIGRNGDIVPDIKLASQEFLASDGVTSLGSSEITTGNITLYASRYEDVPGVIGASGQMTLGGLGVLDVASNDAALFGSVLSALCTVKLGGAPHASYLMPGLAGMIWWDAATLSLRYWDGTNVRVLTGVIAP